MIAEITPLVRHRQTVKTNEERPATRRHGRGQHNNGESSDTSFDTRNGSQVDCESRLWEKAKASGADASHVAADILAEYSCHGLSLIRYWRCQWWIWRGGRYVEMPLDELRGLVRRHLDEKWSHVHKEHVANVLDHIQAVTILSSDIQSPSWLSDPPHGFDPRECLAGSTQVVHLPSFANKQETFSVPGTPAFFTQNALSFDIEVNAPTPKRWLEFLSQIWPDDRQSMDTLQEMFGYMLTPDTRQQKIFLMVGAPRSGKGTIGRVLMQLIGPQNVAGPSLGQLASNFGLQTLPDKSLAIISDARLSGRSDGSRVSENLLKISGEDLVDVDRKYLPPVSCRLPTRLLILSNELPRLPDASATVAKRFILLRMPESFLGREDTKLTEKLIAELPGILLWAIEGWRRLHERGHFVQPQSGAEWMRSMESLASPVAEFVRELCKLSPDARVEKGVLYDAYERFRVEEGIEHKLPLATFVRNLLAACPEITKCRPRVNGRRKNILVGIELRDVDVDSEVAF